MLSAENTAMLSRIGVITLWLLKLPLRIPGKVSRLLRRLWQISIQDQEIRSYLVWSICLMLIVIIKENL
jgi:hypothetical protein